MIDKLEIIDKINDILIIYNRDFANPSSENGFPKREVD
jgi:hypothetical protein